jgi:hypothetical protein
MPTKVHGLATVESIFYTNRCAFGSGEKLCESLFSAVHCMQRCETKLKIVVRDQLLEIADHIRVKNPFA